MHFDAKLDENNRWVVLSKIVPWEEFARLYYKNLKSNRGETEMIRENPYMQYFLGLGAFTYEQVMTPSLLVSIKKRIDLDLFESLTDDLIRKGLKLKAGANQEEVDTDTKDDDDPDPHPGNKGKIHMDATVCEADIKYPTDLDLLNESRQKAEELIDEMCLKLKYFFIQYKLEQHETMYRKMSHQVKDSIVSIHQPHVRLIVRGNAKAKTEFGTKINISLFEVIRFTGEPLERKPVKEIRSRYLERKERREAAERNQVEGKFGNSKRGYGLNDTCA